MGAFGMAIVTDAASAIGATAIPGPWTDSSWDGWFVWEPFGFRFESVTQVGVFMASREIVIDSKAMRKLNDEETIVMMVESEAEDFRLGIGLRMLFKLA